MNGGTGDQSSPEILIQTTIPTVSDGEWTPLDGWAGPSAVLYRSFDISDGLVFIEERVAMGPVPLVPGKVWNI